MGPKILFVSQQLPWPKDSGGNIRTYFMLAALAREFEVVLCSTTDGSPGAREGARVLGELCSGVRLVPDSKSQGAVALLGGLLSSMLRGLPAVLVHNENKLLQEVVLEELASGEFTSVHINHLDTALYFDLDRSPPAVIDTHNLLFEYYERRAEVEKSAARRWVCRREARLLSSHEPRVFRQVAHVIVCSRTERERLLGLDEGIGVSVIPNGVDCSEFTPRKVSPSGDGSDLVFVGDLAYGPNQDAALYFIEEILPLIQEKSPGVRFIAVGKNPPPKLVACGEEREDVIVTGFVEDVRDWVHPAAVYVVPIRYGSGTRLKVLEAFALGKATVSTRIGAEGIETHEGQDILLRDDPVQFAEAIGELLSDPGLAERMGASARQCVETSYDWDRIGEALATLHRDLARRQGRSSS
jgi:polysaccharide biosynthesis protein PslH